MVTGFFLNSQLGIKNRYEPNLPTALIDAPFCQGEGVPFSMRKSMV